MLLTRAALAASSALGTLLLAAHGHAQPYPSNLPLDHKAIGYATFPSDDIVARQQLHLEFRDGPFGYLPSLLQSLDIHPDSQVLVFSKTSFQPEKIGPRNPRAIYFNDEAAVGFVPGNEFLEIAALSRRQGVVFYTLVNRKSTSPRPVRQTAACLKCHYGPATLGVPGIFVGSVFPDSAGNARTQGAIITDHRTPFADRWGGWYVSAARGRTHDRGSAVAPDPAEPENLSAPLKLIPEIHLAPSSDVVALMTFEHQTQMANRITRLGWEWRIHAPPADFEARLEEFIGYLLFADEPELREPVQGVSSFARTFTERGPRDRKQRSLREFDLRTRLFRYPLSYMINSAAYLALPADLRERIHWRLTEILAGKDTSPRFAHLTPADGQAIREILQDTMPRPPEMPIVQRGASRSTGGPGGGVSVNSRLTTAYPQ